jgi:DNA-binding transcriptional LysR family regulator
MDHRHLTSFVAVAEELHFARAADRLELGTSTVSQHVRHLERELGVRLFVRTSRRVTLTPAGARLVARAREVLEAGEALRREARQADSGMSGILRLAYRPTGAGLASRLVNAFRETAPAVDVVPVPMDPLAVVAAVQRGDVDLGITHRRAPGLAALRLRRVPLERLMAPASHRLARRPRLTASDLAGERVIFAPRRAMGDAYEEVHAFFAEQGIAVVKVEAEVHNEHEAAVLVSTGAGVVLVRPDATVPPGLDVVLRPVGPPVPSLTYVLVWDGADTPSAVSRFVEAARST